MWSWTEDEVRVGTFDKNNFSVHLRLNGLGSLRSGVTCTRHSPR